MSEVGQFVRHPRVRSTLSIALWVIIDSVVWCASIYLSLWLRVDLMDPPTLRVDSTLATAVATAALLTLLGGVFGAYPKGTLRASFDEVRGLAASTAITTGVLETWTLLSRSEPGIPRSVPLLAGLTAYSLMLALRFTVRSVREARAVYERGKIPIIVFGAGAAGRLLVHNLVQDPHSEYRPVALLDDDPRARRRRISGVPVRGSRKDLSKVAEKTGAEHMVIAIPSASGGEVSELRRAAERAGLRALSVPPLSRLVGSSITGRDIRKIELEDLLGRRPIKLDRAAIAEVVNHKVVLVTGAGGSIGSELCRQLSRYNPRATILLDRDESALHSLSLDLFGNGLLEDQTLALCDIRDADAVAEVMRAHRPDIVFHTAALKHLPLLEANPAEAWKTNVLGTRNVLAAAAEVGVSIFVNISTDKAADPTSNLGYSKRIAERLTAGYAEQQEGRYLSVRFGNVLGSRGSVIPAFQHQIRRGGPVTITDPNVERFFMLIPEACQLVMQAAAIGSDGEVMVLDMGRQVRILDIAETLISLAGRNDIEIAFTGLRPGEKLSEDLFSPVDSQRATGHPLISAVDVPPLDARQVSGGWTRGQEHMLLRHFSAQDVLAMPATPDTPAELTAEPLPLAQGSTDLNADIELSGLAGLSGHTELSEAVALDSAAAREAHPAPR